MPEARTLLLVPEPNAILPPLSARTLLRASNGEAALAMIEAHPEIELVVLGIDLPGVDGFETASRLLARRDLPIVFLSARTDAESVSRAHALSRYGYVPQSTAEYLLTFVIRSAFATRALESRIQDDMQAKRNADRALKENLSLLQNVIDTNLDMVFVKDTKLRTVLCNEAFARAIGKKPWETYGKTDVENGWDPDLIFGNPAKGTRGFQHDDLRALAGESVHNPRDAANVGSRIAYFDTYKLPLRDESGQIIGVLGVSRDITERIETEQALVQAEERYRQAVSGGRMAAWSFDRQTGRMDSGGTLEQLLGYPAGSLVDTRQWAAVVHPDDLAWMGPLWEELLSGRRESYDIEHRMLARDGSVRWVEVRARPLVEDGRVTGAAGTTCDITAEMREREARKRSETQFQSVIDASPVPTALNDSEGRITYINRAFTSAFGYNLADIPTLSEWWPRAYPDPAYREWVQYAWGLRMKRAQAEGLFEPIEIGVCCKDGSEKTVIATAVVSRDIPGGVHPVILFDITDRKKAEDALAREKERLRVTLQSIADAVITTDTLGRVAAMNEAAEILTGWKESDAAEHDIDRVFQISDEETGMELPSPVAAVLAANRPVENSKPGVLTSRDGTRRLVSESAAPIRETGGRTVGVVLVFRDITERQRLLENMQRTDKLDSLGVLAGGIAHDFNNLLASMFGYVELARGISKDPATNAYLDRAMSAFRRATDLTQQLLTFSRGGAPVMQPGHLDSLIIESASFILSGSNVACTFAIAPDLWPCHFDPGQITQVISNLVINAQQAMPSGGTIRIEANNLETVSATPEKARFVEIRVIDNGPGIPADKIQRIFDPFFSLRPGGSGLGLATCYSIVQKHHGTIEADSRPGSGTTFRVLLPASPTSVPAREPAPLAAPAGPAKTGGRILVMDDEELIRDLARAILGTAGYAVETASNGREALEMAARAAERNEPFNAAILDLTVPGGMGGKDAAAALQEQFPGMCLIASSGYSEDPVMSDPAAYGFAASIRKPYRSLDLTSMLDRHLRE